MPHPTSPESDLLCARTVWATQTFDGRDPRLLGLRLVAGRDRWLVFPGGRLPDGVERAVRDLVIVAPRDVTLSRPTVVDECAALLERTVGPLRIESGPIFAIPPDVCAPVVGARIVTSASLPGVALHDRRPRNWDVDEWHDLIAARLGPWAMALSDDAVVSICHTPRPITPHAAECGVWTHPVHRGRRLAEATTVAWTKIVAAPGRSLFYSTDDRNVPSQRLAAHLGLRLLGRQWTFDASALAVGDAWGRALLDHHRGVWVPVPELETDGGEVGDAMHPEWFFRDFDRWDWWDRELLPRAAQGPALDLGAGAGRAALWLQRQGIEVTAVDSSPGAVEVCRQRGVLDARHDDLNDPPSDRRWRAIFLLCGNLGLGGTWEATRALLTRLSAIAAPDAVLVADTVDPHGPPEIGLRIRYKGVATPWWPQLNVPVHQVAALVDGTGWTIDRHLLDLPDHAVLLRRA